MIFGLAKTDVLNPTLYARLEHLYDEVGVENHGQEPARLRWLTDPYHGDRRLLDFGGQKGEEYVVRCEKCHDWKFRLYVHHLFGQKVQGREVKHLAHCFNEDCLSKPGWSREFYDRLHWPGVAPLSNARILPSAKDVTVTGPPPLPGRRIQIDKLPPYHPAASYLLGRGFDPAALWRDWHVSVCLSGARPDYINGRIVFPLYDEVVRSGNLQPVCWQARHIGEDHRERGVPKYFTQGQKGQYLYGFYRAKRYPFGVLVEGALDAIAAGPPAFASWGDGLSDYQFRRIHTVYSTKPLLLIYDPEAYEEEGVKRRVQMFRDVFRERLAVIRLPEGVDPGSLHRDVTRGIAVRQAREQGVEVDWPEES